MVGNIHPLIPVRWVRMFCVQDGAEYTGHLYSNIWKSDDAICVLAHVVVNHTRQSIACLRQKNLCARTEPLEHSIFTSVSLLLRSFSFIDPTTSRISFSDGSGCAMLAQSE